MSKSKNNLKMKVEAILREFPQSRNDDRWLACKLWAVYYPEYIVRQDNDPAMVRLEDIVKLPSQDTIARYRQIVQNVDKEYLPTKIEVIRRRKMNEEEWRAYIINYENRQTH